MTTIYHKDRSIDLRELTANVEIDGVKSFGLENVTIEGSDVDLSKFNRTLRGHPGLEEFSLVNVTVSNESLHLDSIVEMLLVAVPHIHVLHVEHTPALSANALAAIEYCFSLKKLVLSNNDFKDDCAAKIAAAVAQNSSIEHVDLTSNDMTDVGCAAFAQALEKNIHLHVLRLDGNGRISGNKMSELKCALSERSAKAA